MVAGWARAFRRFVFLRLLVMTISYTLYRHDVMFLKEHFTSPHCPTSAARLSQIFLSLFQVAKRNTS